MSLEACICFLPFIFGVRAKEGQLCLCLGMTVGNLRRLVKLKNQEHAGLKIWSFQKLEYGQQSYILLTFRVYLLVNVETNCSHSWSSFALCLLRPVSTQALVIASGFSDPVTRPSFFVICWQNCYQSVVGLCLYIQYSHLIVIQRGQTN